MRTTTLVRLGLAWLCLAGLLRASAPTPLDAASVGVLAPTVIYVPEEYHTGGAYTAIQAIRPKSPG